MENNEFYPKTDELLASMAMRSDHAFGIYKEEKQQAILKKMDSLYDDYSSGKSNEEISKQFPYGLVTIKQVREELTGEGFYQPVKLSINNSFGKN